MAKPYRGSKRRAQDYGIVFGDDHGQRVLKDIMAYCHLLEPMPNADPNAALVREARRDVANMILMAMKTNPKQYEVLLDE